MLNASRYQEKSGMDMMVTSGLLNARFYDPAIGRFISPDPMMVNPANPITFNRYAYANDNPYRYTDPTGMKSDHDHDSDHSNDKSKGNSKNSATASRGAKAMTAAGMVGAVLGMFEDGPGGSLEDAAIGMASKDVAEDATAGVETPAGLAKQETTNTALSAKSKIEDGATVYRQGAFGETKTLGGQYWATDHPLSTADYGSRYGLPGNTGSDWVMGGKVRSGSNFVTRSAPGIGSNAGGATEAVTESGGVQTSWFHMP